MTDEAAASLTIMGFTACMLLRKVHAATPAAAEMSAPMLIQTAALVGFMGVTFLLGVVCAGMALSLRTRKPLPACIAVALFCANAAEIAKLRDAHLALIVLPEDIGRVAPAWRDEAEAKLAAAAEQAHATLVAGFNTNLDQAQRNVSWAFAPGISQPVTYEKRRLVPVLESAIFTPGVGPKVLPSGIGLEICKDMDFHAMIRNDEVATKPALLAVPAWDFDRDDWSHARIAVTKTAGGFKTLIGDQPLDGRGGETLYDMIGDAFGWLCLALGIGFVGLSFAHGKRSGSGRIFERL